MKITLNGLTAEFTEILTPGGGGWHHGNPGDWQWAMAYRPASYEDFGMSWGICPSLEAAISAASAEIDSINSDFDIDPHAAEVYRVTDFHMVPPLPMAFEF